MARRFKVNSYRSRENWQSVLSAFQIPFPAFWNGVQTRDAAWQAQPSSEAIARKESPCARSAWHGQIQTVKSKASQAPVAMADALAKLLKEYLATWKANPGGFLFLNRRGRPFNATKVVQLGLWPVLDKLGIKRAGMHAFRHCHASLLMEVGANPKVAQEQMRHSDGR